MPVIKSYCPSWLFTPPGSNLFRPSPDQPHPSGIPLSSVSRGKAKRTIAKRGTEAYIAVGREIRWVDLVYLRDYWELEQRRCGKSTDGEDFDSANSIGENDIQSSVHSAQGYRVRVYLRFPLATENGKLT